MHSRLINFGTQCLKNTHNKCIQELAQDTFSFTFVISIFFLQ